MTLREFFAVLADEPYLMWSSTTLPFKILVWPSHCKIESVRALLNTEEAKRQIAAMRLIPNAKRS